MVLKYLLPQWANNHHWSRPEPVTTTEAGLRRWPPIMGPSLSQQPLLEQAQASDLSRTRPRTATSMWAGPIRQPPWEQLQALARGIHESRPEPVNSTGAGPSQQALWSRTKQASFTETGPTETSMTAKQPLGVLNKIKENQVTLKLNGTVVPTTPWGATSWA